MENKCTEKDLKKLQDARNRIGSRADWELKNMKRALSMFPIMNTPEENKRLEDVKTVIKYRKKCIK